MTLRLTIACPDCAVGQQAREMVLSTALWTNLWIALLPFLVALLAVRAIVRRVDRVDRTTRVGRGPT